MATPEELIDIDLCDPQSVRDKIRTLFDDFTEEVRDTILDLADQSYGPFIVTFFVLMQQLVLGQAMNFVSFVASSIIGNVVGGLFSLIGLGLSLINGVVVMLKYLAAKSLEELLDKRIKFSEALRQDVIGLLSLLEDLNNLNIISDNLVLKDIESALSHVEDAHLIVAKENSKAQTISSSLSIGSAFSQASIDSQALNRAVESIDLALDALIGLNAPSEGLLNRLQRLSQKYEITWNLGSISSEVSLPNPLAIKDFFADAVNQISVKYIESGSEGLTEEGRQKLLAFLVDFLSDGEISDFFRTYAASLWLNDRVESLGRRLPIKAVSAKILSRDAGKALLNTRPASGVRSFVDKAGKPISTVADLKNEVRSTLDEAFKQLNVSSQYPLANYPDSVSSMASISALVETSQAVVLQLENWYSIITAQSSITKAFLSPALNKLTGVRDGMRSTLAQKSPSKKDTLDSKLRWYSELSEAKVLINSTTPRGITFSSGVALTPNQLESKFKRSLDLFDELISLITNRLTIETSPGNFEEVKTEASQMIDISDQKLTSLFLSPVVVFNPAARGQAVSGLQAIRVLLAQQTQKDSIELSKTKEFTSSVELNPLFQTVIKGPWDAFIESLEGSLVEDVVGDLKKGNMSKVVNALGNVKYASDELAQLRDCSKRRKVGTSSELELEAISKAIGDESEKTLKFVKKSKESINRLKNKQQILDTLSQAV